MDRSNRVLWTIIGLVLLAAGLFTAAASLGWVPETQTGSPLLWGEVIEQWQLWEPWVWLAVIVVGLIIAWLGWLLIKAQLRVPDGPAMGDLKVGAPDGRGHTVVGHSTLAKATERDLQRISGVHGAAVRLLGERDQPELRTQLEVGRDASLSALVAGVHDALGRFTATSGLGPEAVDVTVEFDGGRPRRVS